MQSPIHDTSSQVNLKFLSNETSKKDWWNLPGIQGRFGGPNLKPSQSSQKSSKRYRLSYFKKGSKTGLPYHISILLYLNKLYYILPLPIAIPYNIPEFNNVILQWFICWYIKLIRSPGTCTCQVGPQMYMINGSHFRKTCWSSRNLFSLSLMLHLWNIYRI